MTRRFKSLASTILLALAIPCLLTACSGGPSGNEIQTQVIASLEAAGMDGIYEVKNVRKIDGSKISDSEYQAEMSYDLHFKVGLKELATRTMREARGLDIFDATFGLETMKQQYGNFTAGEIQHIKSSFLFVKTESGWELLF